MSYGIYLADPVTHEKEEGHFIATETCDAWGPREMRLNIAYSYHPFFTRVIGDEGIRPISGGAVTVPH